MLKLQIIDQTFFIEYKKVKKPPKCVQQYEILRNKILF